MNGLKEEFRQLTSLVRKHLTEEYPKDHWIPTDPEIYEALRRFSQSRPAPIPTPAAPPPEPPRTLQTLSKPLPAPAKKTPNPPAPPIPKDNTPLPKTPAESQAKTDSNQREIPEKPHEDAFQDLKVIFKKHFPHHPIVELPPTSTHRPLQFLIVVHQETGNQLQFLKNLAKTAALSLGPAVLLSTSGNGLKEAAKNRDLRALVGCKSTLEEISTLFKDVPRVTVESLECYLETPAKKAELWALLKQHAAAPKK